MSKLFVALLAVMTLTAVVASHAEVPSMITYQGRLTDSLGNPLEELHDLTFTIYEDEAGAVSLWTETRPGHPIENGLFEVMLGDLTPFPADLFSGAVRFLAISVDTSPPSTPLIPIISVPYAFRSNISNLAESLGDHGAAPGQILKWNGSAWIAVEDLSGSPVWQSADHVVTLRDPADTIVISSNPYYSTTGGAKVKMIGDEIILWIRQHNVSSTYPALTVYTDSGWAVYGQAGTQQYSYHGTATGVTGSAGGPDAIGGAFFAWDAPLALFAHNWTNGTAFWANTFGSNSVCTRISGGRGLRVEPSAIRSAHFEATEPGNTADAIVAIDYSGGTGLLADHIGLKSTTRVADYYGIGGHFEGGYIGAMGLVNATGNYSYTGIKGDAKSSNAGSCYGVYGTASSLGYNYGSYSHASGGSFACAVYGEAYGSATNYAGYFSGDINVTGTIVKSTSLTRTDHPLDPDNKYLQHAQIESPDMLNVYSGNITTDASGYAIVTLPDYVETYNTDFRYQLTCIGDFAQAIIAEKIANNQFTIRTDKPSIEVSWQVTGLRNDLYAQSHPIEAETFKSAEDRGKYVHPELFGKDRAARVGPPPPDTVQLAEKNRKIDQAAQTAIGKQSVDIPVRRSDQ